MLAAAYTAMVPLTIACLAMAVALGLGTGAVFKLVPEWFPDRVGSVTGVVGCGPVQTMWRFGLFALTATPRLSAGTRGSQLRPARSW